MAAAYWLRVVSVPAAKRATYSTLNQRCCKTWRRGCSQPSSTAPLGLAGRLPPLDQMQPLTLMRRPTLAHTFTFGRGGGGGTYTGGGGGG